MLICRYRIFSSNLSNISSSWLRILLRFSWEILITSNILCFIFKYFYYGLLTISYNLPACIFWTFFKSLYITIAFSRRRWCIKGFQEVLCVNLAQVHTTTKLFRKQRYRWFFVNVFISFSLWINSTRENLI